MRKNSFIFVLLTLAGLTLLGCSSNDQQQVIDQLNQQVDSLKQENAKQSDDLKDMVSFVGTLADGLDSIAKQEELLFFTNKGVEGTIVDREQLKKNLEMFENMLAKQKRRISILSDSLKNRGDSISKLFTLVTYLNKQLDEKDSQIKSLREEVENKNFNIAQLRKRVSSLNEANSQLNQKVEKQVEALNTQNQMFNEGYVKIGTKKELTSQGLLSGGFLQKKRVNHDAINKDMFTKVDIRTFTEVTINSSNPKILTQMPASSYRIEKGKGSSILYILDPTAFWSVSNYLIIQTK
jgi:uncharacterized coiled-coil protein SlyX